MLFVRLDKSEIANLAPVSKAVKAALPYVPTTEWDLRDGPVPSYITCRDLRVQFSEDGLMELEKHLDSIDPSSKSKSVRLIT